MGSYLFVLVLRALVDPCLAAEELDVFFAAGDRDAPLALADCFAVADAFFAPAELPTEDRDTPRAVDPLFAAGEPLVEDWDVSRPLCFAAEGPDAFFAAEAPPAEDRDAFLSAMPVAACLGSTETAVFFAV